MKTALLGVVILITLLVGCGPPSPPPPNLPDYQLKKVGSVDNYALYVVEIEGEEFYATKLQGQAYGIVLTPKAKKTVEAEKSN